MPQKSLQKRDKDFVIEALCTLQEELKAKIAKFEGMDDQAIEALGGSQRFQMGRKIIDMMDRYVAESDVLLGSRSMEEAEAHRAMERVLNKKRGELARQGNGELAGSDTDETMEKLARSGRFTDREIMFMKVFLTDAELRVGRAQLILQIEEWLSGESSTRPFEHRAPLRK